MGAPTPIIEISPPPRKNPLWKPPNGFKRRTQWVFWAHWVPGSDSVSSSYQDPRKGGSTERGFCRVQCHRHGSEGHWPQQYIWHSERHSQERRTFCRSPLLKTPFSWFLILAYYLCAKANSPSFSQNSPSLPSNSVRLSEFSSPKQYSRNSIPLPFPIYWWPNIPRVAHCFGLSLCVWSGGM